MIFYNDYTLGPVQKDEALFYTALPEWSARNASWNRMPHWPVVACVVECRGENIYCIDAVIRRSLKADTKKNGVQRKKTILHFLWTRHEKANWFFSLAFLTLYLSTHHTALKITKRRYNGLPRTETRRNYSVPRYGALGWQGHDTGQAAVHWSIWGLLQRGITSLGAPPREKETITWMSKVIKWHRLDLWATATARRWYYTVSSTK